MCTAIAGPKGAQASNIRTLADVVEVTLRKLRRDGLPLPFSQSAAPRPANNTARRGAPARNGRLDETEGVLHQLLGDYTI